MVCKIKGLKGQEIEDNIKKTLEIVMLTEHKDKITKELSGGMKRKLSLAMAIVTAPKVLVLDEPTSGLDVESRRQIWELIKRIKVGRSIIMSSQHLEEADELADRICIMTKGKLLALDTPLNIKNNFGVGYKLIIEPNQQTSEDRFSKLKEEYLDPTVLSQVNKDNLVKEHSESNDKKYVFQFPVA